MRFRQIILICILLFGVVSVGQGDRLSKVVLLETMTLPLVQEHSKWFLQQMSEMGYKDGKNLQLIRLNAEGSIEKAESLLTDVLKDMEPHLVVTNATLASKIAKKRLIDTNIPILFFGVSDPVGAGLIEEVGKKTGTNITGKVHSVPRDTIIEIALNTIHTVNLTKPIRFGYIYSDYPSSRGDIRLLQAAAGQRQDIVFIAQKIPYLKGDKGKVQMLQKALTVLKVIESKIDFWWLPRGPLGINPDFTQLLLGHSKIPILYGSTMKSVEMGSLINVATDPETQGRETGIIADAILKGKKAGTISPTRPSKLQVGLNLSTAAKHKIAIPSEILKLAQGHIYY